MIDRAALLIADLARIPDLLRVHAAAGMPGLDVRTPRRVLLTGLGSSRFAALALAATLRSEGLEVVVEHASTSRPAPRGPGTLLVAISSSGRTPETVVAARRARDGGVRVVAITNRPGSPLAASADDVLALMAGEETSGVASLTYAATIAMLVRLAAALGVGIDAPRVLAGAADVAEAVLASRAGWLAAGADILDGGAPLHVLADAAALGTAEQAALLFRECPRLDADATDAGDWLHVGIYTALPGYRAVLLTGTPYDAQLTETIQDRGGRVVAIGGTGQTSTPSVAADLTIELPGDTAGEPLTRAIVEPLVAASLAAELWQRATAIDR